MLLSYMSALLSNPSWKQHRSHRVLLYKLKEDNWWAQMVQVMYLNQCLAYTAVIFTLLMEKDTAQFVPGKGPLEKFTFLNNAQYLMSALAFIMFLVLIKRNWQTAFAKFKVPGVCAKCASSLYNWGQESDIEIWDGYILHLDYWQIVFNDSLNSK